MGGFLARIAVTILAAYFMGNINGAIVISSLFYQDDVRTHGSGNAGMTNYLRSYGMKKTGLVAAIDLGKAVISCLVGALLFEPYGFYTEGALLAGLCVSLGHDFPAFQGFRGGKGILCGLGFALVGDWRVGLGALALFLIVTAATRYVSLGSCLAALAVGIGFTVFHIHKPWAVALAWITVLLAIFMHRGNIARLVKGTERKLSFGHKEEQP